MSGTLTLVCGRAVDEILRNGRNLPGIISQEKVEETLKILERLTSYVQKAIEYVRESI